MWIHFWSSGCAFRWYWHTHWWAKTVSSVRSAWSLMLYSRGSITSSGPRKASPSTSTMRRHRKSVERQRPSTRVNCPANFSRVRAAVASDSSQWGAVHACWAEKGLLMVATASMLRAAQIMWPCTSAATFGGGAPMISVRLPTGPFSRICSAGNIWSGAMAATRLAMASWRLAWSSIFSLPFITRVGRLPSGCTGSSEDGMYVTSMRLFSAS
mmetsp:Transcript_36183/g.101867  ORF Transcript_36183/g.101867 Transcript_36183/m.101867 type:complete len:212 (-) Transcript_36183:894-1529(-)